MRYRDFYARKEQMPSEDEQDDWVVSRVTLTRDSHGSAFWAYMRAKRDMEKLDPSGADHQLRRFRHWAVGWFEIIIAKPGTACAKRAGRRRP